MTTRLGSTMHMRPAWPDMNISSATSDLAAASDPLAQVHRIEERPVTQGRAGATPIPWAVSRDGQWLVVTESGVGQIRLVRLSLIDVILNWPQLLKQ